MAMHSAFRRYAVLLFFGALTAGAVDAPPASFLKAGRETAGFVVENPYYRLIIDPARGGAVRSFAFKLFDPQKEWIYPNGGGLLEDMIWQQRHPGELQDQPYESKVLEQTDALFRVELWRTLRQEPYPGLVMRTEIILTADSPAIRVRMTLENPTAKEMFPGAWIQNRFFSGGNKGAQAAWRNSYLGIRMSYFADGKVTGDEFVRRPAAGWNLTLDRDLGVGFLALVDYNYLQMHYNCLSMYTLEFFFDRVLLPPGKSWTSEYRLIPVRGVKNCFYADDFLFAGARQDGDTIEFGFRATDKPVAAARVGVKVSKSDRSAVLAEAQAALQGVTADSVSPVKVSVPGSSREPVIVALTVQIGERKTESEFMYAPGEGFYHLQESAVTYRAKLAKKVKPELMGERNLKLTPHSGLAALHGIGLWGEMNRIPEVLAGLGQPLAVKDSMFQSGVLGPELSWQPLLAEDLLSYDWVVLNNVGANALGEPGEIAIEQYVKAGGSLLVCGGLYTLGKSRWDESVLVDVLPVETAGPFDLQPLKKFVSVKGAKGVDLGVVRWLQNVKAVKSGAKVVLTAGGKPALVTGTYGKGRVVVWLGTPMGEPPAGTVPYWESPGWVKAMQALLGGGNQ